MKGKVQDYIDLTAEQYGQVRELLRQHLPGIEVWAYGSRVKFTSHADSDLDLVAFASPEQGQAIADLRAALARSDLPFETELFAWDDLPESFHKNIQRQKLVLQQEAEGAAGGRRWPERPFAEVAEALPGKYIPATEYDPNGPYTIYGSNSIMGKSAKPLYEGPVIAFARIGSNSGATMFSPKACWINNNAAGIKGREGMDTRFLYYWMQSFDFPAIREGSGQPYISQRTLNVQKVPVPPLPEQRAIAHILGTLDDKIELNRRMAQTLEAIAQALFKSWFLDFDPVIDNALAAGSPIPQPLQARAAVRASCKHTDDSASSSFRALFPSAFTHTDELGWIPEGWESVTVRGVADFFDKLRVPLNRQQREERQGIYRYYGATGVMDYVDDYLFDGTYVLVGEDGTVQTDEGRPFVQYVRGKFWVNNHAHVLRAKAGLSNEHLALLLKAVNIVPYITGAVQPKLSQGNLGSVPVVLAPDNVSSAFGQMASGLYNKAMSDEVNCTTLASIREALLPRLLSGTVRVGEFVAR